MGGKIEREIENYFGMIHDMASGAETRISRPAWIEFTTNNACNLRCVMCGVSDGQPLQRMQDENAERLLDEVLPDASLLTPQANSEPMLSNMDLIVRKCREHELYLNLITNATLIDGAYVRSIVDRLYNVSISIDSHIPEVYERLRGRGKFEVVDRNVREIVPVLAESGVHLAFNFVLMADNVDHVDGFVDYVADVGGATVPAEVHVQPMLDNASGCAGRRPEDRFDPVEICAFLDKAAERALARKVVLSVDIAEPYRRSINPVALPLRGIMPDLLSRALETVRRQYPHVCSMLAYYLKIEPNGDVYPCCRGPRELRMGNVHETPVQEIWNNEPYRRLRARMQARDYPEVCRGCDILVANPAFRPD